jgi:hypothetical protein
MSKLDDELKIALRRDQPPEGFAARVVERIHEFPGETRVIVEKSGWNRLVQPLYVFRLEWLPGRWMAAGALAVALLIASVGVYRHRQEELEAERAKAQVVLALQIASAKLNIAQRKVFENRDHLVGDGNLKKENQ